MKKIYTLFIALVASLTFIPAFASAAVVYVEPSRTTISVGDTVILNVKINAEGTTINTVDGDIATVSGGSSVEVKEFSLANSAFGLWPRTPSLSADGKLVSFVGGVPGGFNIEGATMFKIIYEAKEAGEVTISPVNISAYANDGSGTKLPVQVRNTVITVQEKNSNEPVVDEWKAIIAQDVTPPRDFIVVPGQDASLFEGKTFVFFSAVDNETGISYYEVSENGAPAVRSGSTYVLQNQTDPVMLSVTAYDKAGNKKLATYNSEDAQAGTPWNIVGIVGALLVLVVLVVGYRKMKKNTVNAQM
ncbi:MAG TPA: hypothetical protein PLF31_02395 [Candidatus Paceibacterota bacterium]|nr:hypothetical protein [Candidatus Paceibacterota bacterium]